MALREGTIHEVLARKNPDLDIKTGGGSLSKDDHWVKTTKENLEPWHDFNYHHLMNGWGHLLQVQGVRGKLAITLSNSQREINDEDKIDSIIEAWNIECLREALKKGAAHLRGSSTPDITMRKRHMQYRRHKRLIYPDSAIFLRDGDRETSTTLVAGEHKCSTKWDHEQMVNVGEGIWPVRQLLTYCEAARTRYGYIMTDDEVVVFRVHRNPAGSSHNPYNAEWSSIPWGNNGEGRLTVNLAIWWLAMMGLADRHREIVVPASLLRINLWLKNVSDKEENGDTYTHHLSGRKLAALPAGEQSKAA